MSRNWIRYIKLTTGDGNQSYDVSNMRIKFRISHKTTQTPNIADFTIYNLSAQTANAIFQQRNSRVRLEAGYQDNHGKIYEGWVQQKYKGRETPTETFVMIRSQDGDKAYNNATNNETLKAGSSAQDVNKAAFKSMQKQDETLTQGYNGLESIFSKIIYPQPFVMRGMSRKFLRDITHTAKGLWFITNGKLTFIKRKDDSIPGGPIEVNAATGMIGSPLQTYEGVKVRALINPNFEVGRLLRLNNDSIQAGQLDLSNQDAFSTSSSTLPGLSPSGTYRILYIDWVGDTHGIPWYAEIDCNAVENPTPLPLQGRLPA